MSIRIAVDLGGTHIRAAVFRKGEASPIIHKKTKTRSKKKGVFERLLRLIEKIIPENETVDAIGIAVPGPVNPRTGVIINAPNIQFNFC